jgi:hypothetical protein
VNDDDEIVAIKRILGDGFEYDGEDGQWGIDTYCKAVLIVRAHVDRHTRQE